MTTGSPCAGLVPMMMPLAPGFAAVISLCHCGTCRIVSWRVKSNVMKNDRVLLV